MASATTPRPPPTRPMAPVCLALYFSVGKAFAIHQIHDIVPVQNSGEPVLQLTVRLVHSDTAQSTVVDAEVEVYCAAPRAAPRGRDLRGGPRNGETGGWRRLPKR